MYANILNVLATIVSCWSSRLVMIWLDRENPLVNYKPLLGNRSLWMGPKEKARLKDPDKKPDLEGYPEMDIFVNISMY